MQDGLWCRRLRIVGAVIGLTASALLCPPADVRAAAAPPIVPGYDRLRDEAKSKPDALGELLLGELNCTSCHAAEGQKRVLLKGAPDLSNAGARITPQYLRAWIGNPHVVKPGTTMPDLFHDYDAQAKKNAVEALTHFLVSLGGPIAPNNEEGNELIAEQGEKLFNSVGCFACHAPQKNGKDAETKVLSIPLNDLPPKTTVDALTAFLLDPLKVRPASRMPSSNLSRDEA